MKIALTSSVIGLLAASYSANAAAFVPSHGRHVSTTTTTTTSLKGYLDDLTKYTGPPEKEEEELSYEQTVLKNEQKDRFGVGDWSGYVDFGDEFDGGDGQMGVAGDGKKGLEKDWAKSASMATSKTMSAKNAWGKSTGYAQTLIEQGMETTRAQQLENWMNQQEVLKARNQHKYMTEDFDKTTSDDNWRELAKFGVQRNQDFDLDQAFGEVKPDVNKIYQTVELSTRLNQAKVYEFKLRNSFMGFSDFRARFSADTPPFWQVEPAEGSLNGRQDTDFLVRFRPQSPGTTEGWLVIDTDDDKWTFKLIGHTSM